MLRKNIHQHFSSALRLYLSMKTSLLYSFTIIASYNLFLSRLITNKIRGRVYHRADIHLISWICCLNQILLADFGRFVWMTMPNISYNFQFHSIIKLCIGTLLYTLLVSFTAVNITFNLPRLFSLDDWVSVTRNLSLINNYLSFQ